LNECELGTFCSEVIEDASPGVIEVASQEVIDVESPGFNEDVSNIADIAPKSEGKLN
jgi:hypothetical protein